MSLAERDAHSLRPLPLEGRAGEGVVQWTAEGPPPSIPPLKGEGRQTALIGVRP